MNIKKATVYTAELNLKEIDFILTGLQALVSCDDVDELIKDFKLIQTSGVTEITHNG